MAEEFVSIAKIINFHGVKGEVKLGFTKGNESRTAGLARVFAEKDGEYKELNTESVRFHKNFAIVKFKEFNSINDAVFYKGCILYLPKQEIEESLEEDEYLINDLIGMDVYDEDGACIGSVTGIGENSANDILEVEDGCGKKHLIPFVKALVPVVDLKNRTIAINNIEGLIN